MDVESFNMDAESFNNTGTVTIYTGSDLYKRQAVFYGLAIILLFIGFVILFVWSAKKQICCLRLPCDDNDEGTDSSGKYNFCFFKTSDVLFYCKVLYISFFITVEEGPEASSERAQTWV